MRNRTVSTKLRTLAWGGLLLALVAIQGRQVVTVALGAADEPKTQPRRSWTFESDEPGRIARGFTGEVGTWEVDRDGANRVLAQRARNAGPVFNVALAHGTEYKDVDISVRVKAVAGDVDQGGGLVWRAKDKDNYYVCRYNPLEDNYRLYKLENGKRTQFATAKVSGDRGWHTLRATMKGGAISCELDGKKLLEATDSTFTEAGMVGLWTKADAQSFFDELTVAE